MRLGKTGAVLAAIVLAVSMPAQATTDLGSAEKLRKLDIMLMVTALRCRNGAHGFQDDYNRFATNHLAQLNEAARVLKAGLVQRLGVQGANRALDRMSVVMANRYGVGHPTLNCQQLQQEARTLSRQQHAGALVAAADRLVNDRDGFQMARP